ncbi:MAG: tRNA lysidine(34) synthetase TilS [Alphaproteobacteria bacterium]|nr:tRNA lysidine(34) synthetase TilS [Alphaproteobacteria bacterium]
MKAAEPAFPPHHLKDIFAPVAQAQGPRFAIALSGGGDSMALLRLALLWRNTPREIVALTVDHGLRQGSDAEALQVKDWCALLGIEHHTLAWQHGPLASGLQAKARQARYDLLTAWCAAHGVDLLLTAHTAEDQAETVAMRQARTASPRSLAAIWPETQWNGIRILRPLLAERREALRGLLRNLHQPWAEDPANRNESFERVRIRASTPPLTLAALAAASQAEITAARAAAAHWLETSITIAATGMLQFTAAGFAALTPLVRDEVLLQMISLAGGSAPDLAKRKTLTAWLCASEAGRRTLGGVLFAKRKRDVIVAREAARIATGEAPLSPTHPILWDQRFHITGPEGSSVTSMNACKQLKRIAEIPAAVWAGLPVVRLGHEVLAFPQGASHPQVKIEFSKKLS